MAKSPAPVLDAVLVLCLVYFVFGSAVADLWVGFDVDLRKTGWPVHQQLYEYGVNVDPLFLENTGYMRWSALVNGLVGAPLCLIVIAGLLLRKDWVRAPALLHGWALFINMCIVYWLEYAGPKPPLDHVVFNALAGPYVIAPLLEIYRMYAFKPIFVRSAKKTQ